MNFRLVLHGIELHLGDELIFGAYLKRLRQREQFELLRAAEWAGWTCEDWRRSLLPDVQRQVAREAPAGKPRGAFSFRIAHFRAN